MRKSDVLCPRRAWLIGLAVLLALGWADPGRAQSWTPRELLRRMQQSYNQIEAYQCRMRLFARKGDRTENMTLQFAFKKPQMLRARVVEGSRRGNEVAVRRDGKIRGRMGGVLRPFKTSMSRDDRRLRNLRGATVWDAEWGAFLRKIEGYLEQPGATAVVRPGEGDNLVLDVRVTGANGPERHVYVVDRSNYCLHSGEVYEGDVLVSRVVIEEEKLNPDLPDGYFNM